MVVGLNQNMDQQFDSWKILSSLWCNNVEYLFGKPWSSIFKRMPFKSVAALSKCFSHLKLNLFLNCLLKGEFGNFLTPLFIRQKLPQNKWYHYIIFGGSTENMCQTYNIIFFNKHCVENDDIQGGRKEFQNTGVKDFNGNKSCITFHKK